ncbi:putative ribonuclease H-like domain-containing protein [Tanacetum coccineum]
MLPCQLPGGSLLALKCLVWFMKYYANVRRTVADFSHVPLNEYSPSPDDKKQWSLVWFDFYKIPLCTLMTSRRLSSYSCFRIYLTTIGCWFGGKLIQKLRQKGVYEESFSRHAAWIGGKLIQFMHTTMVPVQVKTMKIQAGIQVLRRGELRRQLQLQNLSGKTTRSSSTNSFNTVSTLVNAVGTPRTYNDVGPSFVPLEPRKIAQALDDESWVEAMLMRAASVQGFRRGIVVRNKARLVAQEYKQEDVIDYDKVFAPVPRIKVSRLFLAYASFMNFLVYQMDVKSAFLYGTIEEEYKDISTPIETNKLWTYIKMVRMLISIYTVKSIFRYLKGRPNLGLWYPKDSPFILEAFSDSDYAGASLDRKSTKQGGCQFLGSSAIYVVKNPVYHSKTKHIEIRHHFIRDSYEKRLIEMVKIYIDNNVADVLTKAFDGRLMMYKCSGLYTSTNWIEVGSVPHDLRADEDVHTKGDDSVERAITTIASLDAVQDSDNIIWTQTTTMPNVNIPQGMDIDSYASREKVPTDQELLEKMLNLQLEAKEESTMAFELIKFIKSMLEE